MSKIEIPPLPPIVEKDWRRFHIGLVEEALAWGRLDLVEWLQGLDQTQLLTIVHMGFSHLDWWQFCGHQPPGSYKTVNMAPCKATLSAAVKMAVDKAKCEVGAETGNSLAHMIALDLVRLSNGRFSFIEEVDNHETQTN